MCNGVLDILAVWIAYASLKTNTLNIDGYTMNSTQSTSGVFGVSIYASTLVLGVTNATSMYIYARSLCLVRLSLPDTHTV